MSRFCTFKITKEQWPLQKVWVSLVFTKDEMSSHQACFLLLVALGCAALPSLGSFLFLAAAFPSLVVVVRAAGLGTGWFELMKLE